MLLATAPFLAIDGLSVVFRTRSGPVEAVRDVSLRLEKGRTLGIVGESGSGKSVTSYALMGILDRAGRVAAGSIQFQGLQIDGASESLMKSLRGREISMVFQNPRAALNPIRRIGDQIADVLVEHAQATRAGARARVVELLRKVRIREPEERVDAYPFELSGGMCQRVVIAMALACRPKLLIADEPTTGLDVTTQRAVMDLIGELTRSESMSTILITHDLGLAGEYCDEIVVMEKGRVVESGPAAQMFSKPRHPYTRRLVRATPHGAPSVRALLPEVEPEPSGLAEPPTPRAEQPSVPAQPVAAADAAAISPRATSSKSPIASLEASGPAPLLDVIELVKAYPRKRSLPQLLRGERPEPFQAVAGISFQIFPGESVGLVGESGCGKSTTSAMVMRLLDPSSGSIRFKGQDISLARAEDFARSPLRARLQMVFQDPTDSLDPRLSAARSIADPIERLLGIRDRDEIAARVERLACQVGLPADLLSRLPHQLSGGQKARVGIARALASEPELLVLDEPTAALDVSVQAVVLNLLADLREELGMSYLFVSHDLEVVRLICERVIVMRAGEIVETGDARHVLAAPSHPYTQALIAAAPRPPGHPALHLPAASEAMPESLS
jgi:peptide/nickel transport system ATP-binding protein